MIKICNIADAATVAQQWPAEAVVSLLTPGWAGRKAWDIPSLPLWFHDVNQSWLKPRRQAMTSAQMGMFIEFVEANPGRLLVHCHMGRSRSPAAAIVACATRGMKPDDAVAWLVDSYPDACPNMRVIELGDAALDLQGELVAAVRAHNFS